MDEVLEAEDVAAMTDGATAPDPEQVEALAEAAELKGPVSEEEMGEMLSQAIEQATLEHANAEVEAKTSIPWMDDEKAAKRLITPNYNPVETLMTKLEKWLIMQPEWAVLLAAPRRTRRQAITLISKRLLTIPNRYSNFGG